MDKPEPFSKRHGFGPTDGEITVRHEAPPDLRAVIVDLAYENGFTPSTLRKLVCRVLRLRPDSDNWSDFPNIDYEVRQTVDNAEWYKVYDLVERIDAELQVMLSSAYGAWSDTPAKFETALNEYFHEIGIGWQLVEGKIQVRGPESFEEVVRSAEAELLSKGRTTAAGELRQALQDLSRRPEADVTGAVQHALAALECAARDASGDPKSTLGTLVQRNPGLLPPPLDNAVEKIWGYASEKGRHLREGQEPTLEEAHLLVGLSAALCMYVSSRTLP